MTDVAASLDEIARAVDDSARRRPAYRPLLEYYGKVFAAQETARQHIQLPAPELDETAVALRQTRGFGLISLSEFPIDTEVSKALLGELCHILAASRPEHSTAAARLADSMAAGDRDPQPLFRAILDAADAPVAVAAGELGLPGEVLSALLYQSLQPSLRHASEQMAALSAPDSPGPGGQCPICGSDPAISVIDDNGKRSLFCSFCWHRYPVRRVACAHCGDAQDGQHEYLFDPDEAEYRVDVCKICRRYMKTVDARQLSRPLYPPLEQVATLHLDMLAKEKGFNQGI